VWSGDRCQVVSYNLRTGLLSVLARPLVGLPRLYIVTYDLTPLAASPAVLVTAYRPDPGKWSTDFLRRKR